MFKKAPILFLALNGLVILAVIWFWPGNFPRTSFERLLSRVFQETTTPEQLSAKYWNDKLRILLVPGHDNEYSGALANDLTEAEANLRLTRELYDFFSRDEKFEVSTVRDLPTGEYTPIFENYFAMEKENIQAFMAAKKGLLESFVADGSFAKKSTINHNFAPAEAARRLYGINKWSNENGIDLTLHIHFNDYPGRNGADVYSGFAIYIPEEQYPNARASRDLARTVFQKIAEFSSPSDHPLEKPGIIESQELIALGSYASQDKASILIEYGYIYEPQFNRPILNDAVFKELAWRTYLGIKNYFEPGQLAKSQNQILPYVFTNNLRFGNSGIEVLALQSTLRRAGLYPPPGKTLNQCPLNGNFRACVEASVKLFQAKYQVEITGVVGPRTLDKLNQLSG